MFGGFSVAHLHFLYVRNKHFLATTTTSPATTAFLIVSSHGNECVFCGRMGVCLSAPPEHAGKGKAQMCCILKSTLSTTILEHNTPKIRCNVSRQK
jgi:hypothetical protein